MLLSQVIDNRLYQFFLSTVSPNEKRYSFFRMLFYVFLFL